MKPQLPEAAHSIEKGIPLKLVLDKQAISQLADNLQYAYPELDAPHFFNAAFTDLKPLSLKERGFKIAGVMKDFLPSSLVDAIDVMIRSLTPPLKETSNLGLSGLFYLPHVCFVERYGLDQEYNQGNDPFDISMNFQYELTKRFSAEFSIRNFIIDQPERTYSILYNWISDKDPHVRRLCSEGTRPRLPWAQKIQFLVEDPSVSLPILERLKNDPDLYVRRSVANHVGDIAKDHLDLALQLCEKWLDNATPELKWVIRHALRYPSKKGNQEALRIRQEAK